MSDDPYVDPATGVLRNKYGIKDSQALERVERRLTAARIEQGVPRGDFDLGHLQAIHKHLFQDIYDWAGQVRTVEISKGGNQFQPRQFIGIGMADVHKRIRKAGYFRGTTPGEFARGAAEIIGDVNHVHPFREGNGRAQREYLKQLAARAGHTLDLTRIRRDPWLEASREAHIGRYEPMARVLEDALTQRERSQGRGRHQGRDEGMER